MATGCSQFIDSKNYYILSTSSIEGFNLDLWLDGPLRLNLCIYTHQTMDLWLDGPLRLLYVVTHIRLWTYG